MFYVVKLYDPQGRVPDRFWNGRAWDIAQHRAIPFSEAVALSFAAGKLRTLKLDSLDITIEQADDAEE